MALATQKTKGPTSTVAARAGEIDTYSMCTNRIVLASIGGLVLVAGSVIGSILVYHGPRDTWERDNATKVLALVGEAQTLLDGDDRVAALAKYEQLIGFVGGRALQDERLRRALSTACEKKQEIERSLTAEEDRRRKQQEALAQEEARKRQEEQAAEQRHREEERKLQEEARRRELARRQERERREKEARENPIEISDIGVKVVDTTSSMDWCTYSWKATITNRTAAPVSLSVILTLYDEEGYELESDYKFGVVIRGRESKIVTGQSMTKLSTFNRAAKYGVSVQ
jgi:flagellar biosynthesis GTPase FlhF